jgi:hypothetical protein
MARSARKVVMSEEPEPSGLANLLQQLPEPAIPGGAPQAPAKASDQGGGPDDDEEKNPDDRPADEPGRDPAAPPDGLEDLPRREPDDDRAATAGTVFIRPDGTARAQPTEVVTATGGPYVLSGPITGEVIPPSGRNDPAPHRRQGLTIGPIRYESRIRILEAYQYKGLLADAPDWVDRNWMAHGDYDPLRNIEAGPALRVPTPRGDYALVRPGDYVVKQEVVLAPGLDPDVQLECWPQDSFERLFIPAP